MPYSLNEKGRHSESSGGEPSRAGVGRVRRGDQIDLPEDILPSLSLEGSTGLGPAKDGRGRKREQAEVMAWTLPLQR